MTEVAGYRQAIANFATGVVIVTAVHEGRRYAMTANALTSVSLDPILLLVCFTRDSDTGRAVRESGWLALNVLDVAHGEEIVRRGARKQVADADKLDGVPVTVGQHGLPLIDDALAHVVCRVERILDGGDHEIVVGEVVHFDERQDDDAEPMLFFRGGLYGLVRGAQAQAS